MGDVVTEHEVVDNPNFRYPVQVDREWPDLDGLGAAGARMKLDLLLLKPEGMSPEDHAALRDVDLEVLRTMAVTVDPAFGVTHQVAAIGAMAERRDREALLVLADRARDQTADDLVRIAAISALGEIGGAGVDVVIRELVWAKKPSIRSQAVRALAKVGDLADVGLLERVARTGDDPAAALARSAAAVLRSRANLG